MRIFLLVLSRLLLPPVRTASTRMIDNRTAIISGNGAAFHIMANVSQRIFL